MSQENVEILRRLYEQWASGDLSADFFHPDVEYSRIGAETPDMEGRWFGLDACRPRCGITSGRSRTCVSKPSASSTSAGIGWWCSRATLPAASRAVCPSSRNRRLVHAARRQDRALRRLLEPCRRPQSRRAVGVGHRLSRAGARVGREPTSKNLTRSDRALRPALPRPKRATRAWSHGPQPVMERHRRTASLQNRSNSFPCSIIESSAERRRALSSSLRERPLILNLGPGGAKLFD